MRLALNETTNCSKVSDAEERGKKKVSDKERVLLFLKDVCMKTGDHSLKYDLNRCIEMIEGKENQEVVDLRNALEEALVENEVLFTEKCELAVTLECMKAENNGI
ncbi:hypothetical protein CWI42_091210 [Ordospora colligata]|uniref:Uncharacterized protein n=1 Tax=Ordospora colligata OC4 TaxID=1354746 RepID=A0A0B2UJN9_9MICR|nr:uncharacterized protein M896_091230 [Ordospora colligata OC4]KHN69195.1 hypothetical protein M896_091230 [Ordospora colligata OC4]TBU14473.1 hypothetical protein CWI40_091190 [Ordospora colligata]TBU14650.1 hypothetical protein CWI41_091220 [Ordospora colligata]TBU18035.1 hypothetical protein CWI42_091210 [Ordospora colligata]